MKVLFFRCVVVPCFLVGSSVASAAEVTIVASKDNTLYEDANGSLSNGAGEFLFAGRVGAGGGGDIRRGLMAFDVAAAVPAGSTITDATLSLNMSKTVVGPTNVTIHKLLVDWGEGSSNADLEEGMGTPAAAGDATWTHRFFGTTSTWTGNGAEGDYTATASATTSVNLPARYSWNSAGLLADVISWYTTPATNFGWLMKGNEELVGSAKRFDSRQNPTEANRPTLTVIYTPPSAVPEWTVY